MISIANRHPTTSARRRALAAVAVGGSLTMVSAGCSASSVDVPGATSAASEASSAVASASGAVADAAAIGKVPTGAGTQGRDEKLQEQLDALVKAGYPGVAASVTDEDGKTVHYTAGVADVRTREPMPVDPHVRIASNTKTFTATVVLQLVGEGTVDLDAPVETYLPGLVRGQGIDGRNITVRQLLQQTSGLPAYDSLVTDGDLSTIQHTYFEPRRLLDAALAEPAHFAPGAQWEYSNTNYVVAGLIIERVTQRPVGEEITQRIIDPLGLQETSWPTTGDQTIPSPHPRGYLTYGPDGEPTAPSDITELDPSLGWAAGQLISTPSDLGTFFRALLDGELLQPAQQQEMETVVPADGFEPEPGWGYGLGLATRQLSCGVQAWGHGGDIQGFETRDLATRDGRSAVIALTALPAGPETLTQVNTAVETAICDQG